MITQVNNLASIHNTSNERMGYYKNQQLCEAEEEEFYERYQEYDEMDIVLSSKKISRKSSGLGASKLSKSCYSSKHTRIAEQQKHNSVQKSKNTK